MTDLRERVREAFCKGVCDAPDELDEEACGNCVLMFDTNVDPEAILSAARALLSAEMLSEEEIRQAYRDLVSNTDYLESGPATDPSVAYFKGQRYGFYMGMSTMQSRILGPAPVEKDRTDGPIRNCTRCGGITLNASEICTYCAPVEKEPLDVCSSCGSKCVCSGNFHVCTKCGAIQLRKRTCPDCAPVEKEGE